MFYVFNNIAQKNVVFFLEMLISSKLVLSIFCAIKNREIQLGLQKAHELSLFLWTASKINLNENRSIIAFRYFFILSLKQTETTVTELVRLDFYVILKFEKILRANMVKFLF
jgi:hypothetical protein